ncbi:MAG: hypothetical protein H6642_15280 [Caldilineaceae bacterium]|nr:hypothetical protein [Caldilineaceae bacterium]
MSVHALLDFHLVTPVMVTGPTGGDPNSEITLPYLPGSAIRGAFVARYLGTHAGEDSDDLASDPDFSRLFLNGGVRYLNAYLLQDGVRTLPAPASWLKIKDSDVNSNSVRVYDQAVQPYRGEEQLKPLNGSFFIDRSTYMPGGPERHVAIHIARSNRQRPSDRDSTVFRYDSLAPGQTFRAIVLADNPADLETLQAALPDGSEITMGRSHRAGYGLVRVSWSEGDKEWDDGDEDVIWSEYVSASDPPEDRLLVTLLSDCLIREPESGAYAADLLSLLPLKPHEVIDAFADLRVVGGFNRKWNLPLSQGLAIAAGSVFVYPYSDALAGKLAELETTGIGERIVEGFGRIAVNWHAQAEFDLYKSEPGKIKLEPIMDGNLEGESLRLAETMAQRLTAEDIERKLTERLSELKIATDRTRPSNSQLSRLRIVVKQDLRTALEARAQGQDDCTLAHLRTYLDKDRLRKPARDQLRRARIADGSLLAWLQRLVDDSAYVWQALNFDLGKIHKIGSVQARLTNADAVYYSARLIDAVCRQATKVGQKSAEAEFNKEGARG